MADTLQPCSGVTFEEVYDFVAEGGVYMIEDVTQSGSGSFLEFAKQTVDGIYGHYNDSPPSLFTKSTMSVAFYDQQVVFEKGSHPAPPQAEKRGTFWMPYNNDGSLSTLEGGVDATLLAEYRDQLQMASHSS